MKKNLLYLMASTMAVMAEHNILSPAAVPAVSTAVPPKRTCKDCYFCPRGTFCKQVKHNVNKQTPANRCVYFKEK